MLKVFMKAAYMPVAILAVTAAGSVYTFIKYAPSHSSATSTTSSKA
jgi:hypothetical protein